VRWIADECVSARLVKLLREGGHDVAYVAEMAASAADTEIISLARRENRLLLTDDKDFGELVVRRRWPVPGLVLMRVASEQPETRWKRLKAAIAHFNEGLYGRYVVIEEGRFRFRPLRGVDDEK
jgi:predicted nuclease of predicted toxin-antitoxin system